MRRQFWLVGMFALMLATLLGCGPGGSTIHGTLTKGSNPYTPATGEQVSITLTDSGKSFNGVSDQEGKFTIQNIPNGKYSASIIRYVPAKADGKGPSGPPATKKYPEQIEVSGTGNITIDMDKLDKVK